MLSAMKKPHDSGHGDHSSASKYRHGHLCTWHPHNPIDWHCAIEVDHYSSPHFFGEREVSPNDASQTLQESGFKTGGVAVSQ